MPSLDLAVRTYRNATDKELICCLLASASALRHSSFNLNVSAVDTVLLLLQQQRANNQMRASPRNQNKPLAMLLLKLKLDPDNFTEDTRALRVILRAQQVICMHIVKSFSFEQCMCQAADQYKARHPWFDDLSTLHRESRIDRHDQSACGTARSHAYVDVRQDCMLALM
jgi:hypothetical protein